MLPRTMAATAAFACAALVALPLASPAQAEPELSCQFNPPARLAIFKDVTTLAPSVTGSCREFSDGYGYWYLDPANPADGVGGYAGVGPASAGGSGFEVYDEVALGTLSWNPDFAGTHYDADYCEEPAQARRKESRQQDWRQQGEKATSPAAGARTASRTASAAEDCDTDLFDYQNSPVTVVKLASAPYLTATRSGSRVTLNVTSNTWSPGSNKFFAHAMGGELQIQNANGTWSRLGNPFVTASNGKRSFAFTIAGARTFRYAIYSTGYSWDKVSTAVRR